MSTGSVVRSGHEQVTPTYVMNSPPGCPFQTRCRFKDKVAGGLCEKEVPPMRTLKQGHHIKCHLGQDVLDAMEPVIKIPEDA